MLTPQTVPSVTLPGDTRADPVPLYEQAEAGPWFMSVTDVLKGPDAIDQVAAASSHNDAPRDGFTYVLVQVRAENTSERPVTLDAYDFALTGRSGNVRRFLNVVPPSPSIDATVAPGDAHEGWVVLGVLENETDLLLVYDSLTLSGTWANRVFALEPGASVLDSAEPIAAPNDAGTDPAAPVGLNSPVTTEDWQVELIDVARGQAVFNLFPESDYRTRALGQAAPQLIPTWLALRIRITNTQSGSEPAFLSPTAFMLAGAGGSPIQDYLTLTPPDPDASGVYYSGASREGWVVFQLPDDYGASTVRFLPFRTDTDPRYLTYDPTRAAQTPLPETEPLTSLDVEAGTIVLVIESSVNLRPAPTIDGEIVETMSRGTELIITGPPEEGDDHLWYPVENPATGSAGYVARDFLGVERR